MNHPDFTIVTDNASASSVRKGFMVGDAMAKSDFGVANAGAMGFTCDAAAIKRVMDSDPSYKEAIESFAKDAGLSLGDGNIDALGQFFMLFNEATINVLYRGRTAKQTFGVKTMGDWTTERVVFKTRELTAPPAQVYDDWSRAPYTGYNYGWDFRDTLRLEWALEVTKLEEAVGSIMRRNPYKDKKDGIVLNQEIWLNEFFWNGTTAGSKKLYGVFSEPNLRAAEPLPIDIDSGSVTTEDVIAALLAIKQKFATDLQGNGDVDQLPITIACPLKWQYIFTIPSTQFLKTANDWLAANWKNATVEFKPELDTADSGDPMMMVFTKSVPGVGMDTINLIQTSALRLIGAMPSLKGREEAYSAAIAGAMVACPLGVQCWTNGGDTPES